MASPAAKPLILVVDDDPDSLTYLYLLLDSEGYPVATRCGGFDALRFIADVKPKLVISDLRMPEMDGLQLLEKIKEVSPATHVILLTAYGNLDTLLETLAKGGDDMLRKPYRNPEILWSVQRALSKAN